MSVGEKPSKAVRKELRVITLKPLNDKPAFMIAVSNQIIGWLWAGEVEGFSRYTSPRWKVGHLLMLADGTGGAEANIIQKIETMGVEVLNDARYTHYRGTQVMLDPHFLNCTGLNLKAPDTGDVGGPVGVADAPGLDGAYLFDLAIRFDPAKSTVEYLERVRERTNPFANHPEHNNVLVEYIRLQYNNLITVTPLELMAHLFACRTGNEVTGEFFDEFIRIYYQGKVLPEHASHLANALAKANQQPIGKTTVIRALLNA